MWGWAEGSDSTPTQQTQKGSPQIYTMQANLAGLHAITHRCSLHSSGLLTRGNFHIPDPAIQQQEELPLPLLSLKCFVHRRRWADLDLLHCNRGTLGQWDSTARIILIDPVLLLGGKNFHQSAHRLSPAGGWKRKRSRVGLGRPPTGRRKGCPQKERKKKV